jgi:uncharacterized protein (DUF362 family)/Pyruvate/2-oxoacid:ferredoxin oxidoreductase delta subunit
VRPTVSIVNAKNYNSDELILKVSEAIDLLGGIEKFIQPEKKVLIKPNLLSTYKPEQAITTHPEFVRAVIHILKKIDCEIFLGDSPSAWVGKISDINTVYKTTGMYDLCKQEDVNLVRFEEAFFIGEIPITCWAKECDYIISLPKFKTHDLTVLTGAVKNLFGLIPGMFKAELHRRYPHPDDFSKILIKIATNIKPTLSIVDGVVALEGEGPATAGVTRNLGLILAGADTFALDIIMARIMGLAPEDIPTIKQAGDIVAKDIEIKGEDIFKKKIERFKLPSPSITKRMPRVFFPIARKIFYFNITVKKDKCISCGRCLKVCPAGAVIINDKQPRAFINQKKCIQCFCCREVCPVNAIDIKKSFGFRILTKLL